MRKIIASVAAGAALVLGGQALAADMYIPDVPEVDYDLGGSFYLRGSGGWNWHKADEVVHPDISATWATVDHGYGYSVGAGFGYETGTGLRFDGTVDLLGTEGLSIVKDGVSPDVDGEYTLTLRSTVALANVYYDFSFGSGGFGYTGSGAFGYVGAGAGVAWNHAEVSAPATAPVPSGSNMSGAAAVMAGVGYDMGAWVADVGYRGLYINQINNSPTSDPNLYYEIDNNFIHEVRGTVRYRFD